MCQLLRSVITGDFSRVADAEGIVTIRGGWTVDGSVTIPMTVPLPVPNGPPTRKISSVSLAPGPTVLTKPENDGSVSSVMKSVEELPVSVLGIRSGADLKSP